MLGLLAEADLLRDPRRVRRPVPRRVLRLVPCRVLLRVRPVVLVRRPVRTEVAMLDLVPRSPETVPPMLDLDGSALPTIAPVLATAPRSVAWAPLLVISFVEPLSAFRVRETVESRPDPSALALVAVPEAPMVPTVPPTVLAPLVTLSVLPRSLPTRDPNLAVPRSELYPVALVGPLVLRNVRPSAASAPVLVILSADARVSARLPDTVAASPPRVPAHRPVVIPYLVNVMVRSVPSSPERY